MASSLGSALTWVAQLSVMPLRRSPARLPTTYRPLGIVQSTRRRRRSYSSGSAPGGKGPTGSSVLAGTAGTLDRRSTESLGAPSPCRGRPPARRVQRRRRRRGPAGVGGVVADRSVPRPRRGRRLLVRLVLALGAADGRGRAGRRAGDGRRAEHAAGRAAAAGGLRHQPAGDRPPRGGADAGRPRSGARGPGRAVGTRGAVRGAGIGGPGRDRAAPVVGAGREGEIGRAHV